MADLIEANLFELSAGGVSVTYASSSEDGEPRLTIRGLEQREEVEVSGDRLQIEYSDLGTEVTVYVEAVPDERTVTVTLLVPPVNVADGSEGDVHTLLIETTAHTTIGGPRLVEGPLLTYRVTELRGTAKTVWF